MKGETTISSRLSKRIMAITSGVFLAAIVVVTIFTVNAITNEVKQTVTKSVDNVILQVEKSLTEVEVAVETLAKENMSNLSDPQEVLDLVASTVNSSELITSCALAYEPFRGFNKSYHCMPFYYWEQSTNGLIFKQLGTADYDYHTLDWYQIPKLLKKSYWSEPSYDSEGTGKIVTTYSKPLYDENGELIGILKADVDLDWLNEIIYATRPYDNSYMVVIGRNGSYISHPDRDLILNETIFSIAESEDIPDLKKIGMSMVQGKENFVRVSNGEDGFFAAFAPFQNGWSAMMACSFRDVFTAVNRIIVYLLIVVIVGLFVLYFASRKAIRRLTAPITEFTYSAMNMSRGFFNAQIPEVDTDDEMKKLQESLFFLQHSINRYISELKSTTASNERFESELNIAREIQLNMVSTQFPESEEFDLFATLSPAKEVGGDLYDFFVQGRTLNIAIGDVSGKGVPAALYMAILRYGYRFIAGMHFSINEVLQILNRTVSDGNDSGMFATMFVARINLDTMEMEYCNGGHNPIVTVTPEGKAEFLKAESNIAVGLFPEFEYVAEKIQLAKGSRLLLYTDGISEAEARDFSQFGEERILTFASEVSTGADSRTVTESLLENVKNFTGDNDQNDDITIMTIKF